MYLFSIPDDLPTPSEWPQKAYPGLVPIGHISLKDHTAAKEIWGQVRKTKIEIHPFEDTRLYAHELKNLVELIEQHPMSASNTSISHILNLLKVPMHENKGLVSFVD